MQDLLAKLLELMAAHPGASVAVVAAGSLAVVIWGVMATSYRYR